MNIGNQIKTLRLRRGVTQEALAAHFGITAQAVSKWECGLSVPDIGMLPGISAYFGVSIDELFALSDEIRMDRIQNMLWDLRFTNPVDMENERQFLLDLARREPDNPDPHCMLAQLELHMAQEHRVRAEEYAMEILNRTKGEENGVGCGYLSEAMNGVHVDFRRNTHNELIDRFKLHLEKYPQNVEVYIWLIAQLLDDSRICEAEYYCQQMAGYEKGYLLTVQKIKIALAKRDITAAVEMWGKLGEDYPDYWSVWQQIGDFQTQTGAYCAAKESYNRAISLLPVPRYKDPIVSLALTCEMDGDIDGAIEARELELDIAEKEWGSSTGESVDIVRREIQRLKNIKERNDSNGSAGRR